MKVEVEFVSVPQTSSVLEEVDKDFHVLVHLRTKPKDDDEDGKERTPFELACVLDASGSMSGDRIKWSKRAIRKIIKHMRPGDVLHLIKYDTYVDVVFENGDLKNKEKLVEKVREIRAGSSTNTSGALEKARDLLVKSKRDCVKRIFLFSDGHCNAGITDKNEMNELVHSFHKKHGITTTSFGIGAGFDEAMMKEIAVAGKGRYLFLEEQSITSEVSKAIHDMLDMVGTDGILKFEAVNGTKIKRLYANEIDSNTEFQIGDVMGGNLKQVLIQLEIDPSKREDKTAPNYTFLKYSFTYKSKKKGEELSINQDVEVKVTKNKKAIHQSDGVFIAKKIQAVADVNHEVLQLLKNNKTEEAIKLKDEMIKGLEKIEQRDETGHVKLVIINEKESLEMMKTKDSQTVQRNVGFCTYRARRASFSCLRNQSDSDEWSSEEESFQPQPKQQQRAPRRRTSGKKFNIKAILKTVGQKVIGKKKKTSPRRTKSPVYSLDEDSITDDEEY